MGAGLRATRQGRVWTVASTPLSINVSIHLIISGDRRSHPTRLARRCLRSFNRLWRCLSLPFRKSAGRHQGAEVSADARRPTLDAGKLWLSAVVTWWWLRPQVYRSMIQTLLSANGRRHLTCARLHCATSGRLSLPLRAPAAARPTPPAAASQSQSYSFCPPSRTMRTVPATVKPRHWLYVYVRLYVVVLRLTRCCRSRAPRDTTGTCVDSGQYAIINQRINSSYHFRRSTISPD